MKIEWIEEPNEPDYHWISPDESCGATVETQSGNWHGRAWIIGRDRTRVWGESSDECKRQIVDWFKSHGIEVEL